MESNEESLNLSHFIDLNYDFSSEIPLHEQSYNLNSISPFTDGFWSVSENDQDFLKTLTSGSVQDYFNDGSSSNKETESLNKKENKTVEAEKTTITDTFSDSESETSIHLAGKKYMEMRRKNNIASQRSRKIRKQKNSEMAQTLKKLEKENHDLLLLAQKLEKERDSLKNQLMSVIAKK